ncbi:MAG: PQQ-binding-like beta-propeller repeat protein [Candidatus Methanoperedens sp.]|nr:PQQ-binding-like beta-propeller repeat protein [Candidatus Methanoperedens sp.]
MLEYLIVNKLSRVKSGRKKKVNILTLYTPLHKLLILSLIFIFLPSSVSANWQNYGGDLAHSGYSDSSPIPLELKWKYHIGNSEISTPIIDAGILFAGSDDNNLYAIDAVKGELKWQFPTLGKVYTPAAKNGVVFAASFDNNIYAIDYNGNQKWSSNTGFSTASPPIVYNNILYGGSDRYIYAIYVNNGSTDWRYATGGWVESAPAISQGMVYAGSNDNYLYALDAGNKNLRWKYPAGGSITSSPAVINGIVFAGANDFNVYAIDANSGELKWREKTNDVVKSSPAVFQNSVYAGSNDNTLYAIDMDNGDIIWKFVTGGWIDSQPIVTKDIVYAGSKDGTIYAIDREKGTKVSSYDAGSGIISLAISDNILYATSNDGYVYAFGTEVPESTTISKVAQDLIPPELRINPIPINVTSETLTVSGTAKDPAGILIVTVNGIDAGADNWKATLTLSEGINIISIKAVDKAGNIKTEIRTVRYIPPEIQETPAIQTPGFSFYFSLISFAAIVIVSKIKKNQKIIFAKLK